MREVPWTRTRALGTGVLGTNDSLRRNSRTVPLMSSRSSIFLRASTRLSALSLSSGSLMKSVMRHANIRNWVWRLAMLRFATVSRGVSTRARASLTVVKTKPGRPPRMIISWSKAILPGKKVCHSRPLTGLMPSTKTLSTSYPSAAAAASAYLVSCLPRGE